MRRSCLLLGLPVCAGMAFGGVTFEQPVRTITATTLADGASDSLTSLTLEALNASVQQTASVTVGGQVVETGAIAGISCTFDPTGVRSRTRLQGHGAASALATADNTIEVLLVVDTPTPWKIRSSALVFTAGDSTLGVALTNESNGATLFATDGAATGEERIDAGGVLTPGTYRFSYDVRLVASSAGCDRDFALRIEVPCVADVDDGTRTGVTDGAVTIDDLLHFLDLFELGDAHADVDDGTASAQPDNAVTIDDMVYYLVRFEQGC